MQFDLIIFFEEMVRVLGETLRSKRMIAFLSICLACLALHALMTDTTNPRVLVGAAIITLVIVVLFIFTKPGKPSRPQHPIPSCEPLMRGIKSR